MKAPTPRKNPSLGRNWLTVARVPGITFAIAALLLPGAAAGLAPAASLDLPVAESALPDVQATPAAEAPVTPPSTATTDVGSDPAVESVDAALGPSGPFTTGQRLSPEQVSWFRAHADAERAHGTMRGNAVYTSW